MDTDERHCAAEECGGPAGSTIIGCPTCLQYLCEQHRNAPYHKCDSLSESEDEEVWRSSRLRQLRDNYSRISVPQVVAMAEELRPGRKCVAREPPSMDREGLAAGLYHIHIKLDFDDGVMWWARVRQEGYELPVFAKGRSLMESEIATQRRMHAGDLLVPNIWQAPVDSSTLNICFVEHVEGSGWEGARTCEISAKDDITIRDYAQFSINLSALEFHATGSLEACDNTIGPYRSYEFQQSKAPYFFGPFGSLGAMYVAWLDRLMANVVEGTFMRKNCVPWYLMALEIRHMILQDPDLMNETQSTYIKHGDSRDSDHIRVDGQGKITGVIDWEFAVTTPKADAFAAPACFIDWESFWNGDNALSQKELALMAAYTDVGREDLAGCVRGGRKYQRLEHGVGHLLRWPYFSALVETMTGSKPVEPTCEDWQVMADRKWATDSGLRGLLKGGATGSEG